MSKVLMSFFALLIGIVFLQSAMAKDFPMFRGNPQHTGVYDTKGVRDLGGLKWKFQTQGPIRSSPVIANGILYVGSGDNFLYALNVESGKMIWKFEAEAAVQSTPTVSDNLVYFAARNGGLYAVDAKSGSLKWKRETTILQKEIYDLYVSSPVISGGLVYFGSPDGNLYALDPISGTTKWTLKTGGLICSSPAVDSGTIYVGSFDGNLYAADAKTGEIKWKYKTEGSGQNPRGEMVSSPAVDDGIVTIGSRDAHLYTLDAKTGALRWSFSHQGSWVITSPSIYNGIVYAGSSDGRFVQAVDIATGKEKWRTSKDGWFWSSPAVVDDTLYIGSGNQSFYALDLSTGEERWHFGTAGPIYSSPTVSDGVVYFGSDDGNLYALDGASSSGAKKAVFWDERLIYKFFSGHQQVRDYLSGQGYKVLNVPALSAFLRDRVADKAPSVVVFAMDTVPFNLTISGPNKDLIKQYLAAGGKIVWLGMPPTIFKKSPDSGQPYDYDKENPPALFGLNFDGVDGDSYTVKATAEGKKWGLQNWWAGAWSVDPASVTTVLGLDEKGRAAAWVKNYGGPEGTGLVFIWGNKESIPDLSVVKTVAEHGLK